jgi:uncharacterized Zn-finger protein
MLSSLLDANQTQSNVSNKNEISIEREYRINETSETNHFHPQSKSINYSCQNQSDQKLSLSLKKHKCETCKQRFICLSQLKIHKRIHSKEKPFACDQCQMTFTQMANLKRHKNSIHTGEKLFSCEFCQKKFSQSHNLIIHKRIHTGERPYSCDLCPKKFTQSYDLTRHQRIHSRIRPQKLIKSK